MPENILDDFLKVRADSERLCDPLHTEDYIPQPAEFVSPPKWNLAHTTWFFEEMILKPYKNGYRELNPLYSYLFNSYYNLLGEKTPRDKRGDLSRPFVNDIYTYRRYVDQEMTYLIKDEMIVNEDVSKELKKLIVLGINHEQQHQELFLTDLKYTFSLNPVYPEYGHIPYCERYSSTENGYVEIDEGIYEVGADGKSFCFDNELSRHKVYLNKFKISQSLVTNKEYLEFLYDEGYKKVQFWHDDAIKYLQKNDIGKPLYWILKDGDWYQYTLAGLRPLDLESPVTHISYYEAYAYARWKNKRLPTEQEWEVASDFFKWGDRWEWTESAYLPYPGYKIPEGAVGEYNGKFMVNQMVARGASVATPEGHSRKTYRNFFHPNMAWQFNGIRLAE